MKSVFRVGIIILFSACIRSAEEKKITTAARPDNAKIFSDEVEIKYAKGFTVNYENTYKEVKVLDPFHPGKILARYVLVEEGKAYQGSTDEIVVRIPLKKIACVSTTHLPFLSILDETNALVGFGGLQYVKNPKVLKRIKENKIKEIGFDHQINKEAVIDLEPDALMVYPYEGMDFKSLKKAGISIVYNAEYLEQHPLGKAEWIKFVALFFNKEAEANRYFYEMEERYLSVKKAAMEQKSRPTVFSGKAFKGTWHVPGGKSFAAAFIRDAGGDYLWGKDEHNNVIPLNFESVLDTALHADTWLLIGEYNGKYSLNDLKQEDERYAAFDAFSNKSVLYCNSFYTDYFGDGVAEPDVILKDLAHFFHPGLYKNYSPKYFKRLE